MLIPTALACAEKKPEKKPADNSDGEDADFEEDFDEDDDDDDSSDDDAVDNASGKTHQAEVEAEDLEDEGGAGPSSASNKRKADDDTFGRIEHGLSGDEVDVGNIIEGGRRARRGRGDSKPKYTAKAAVASDEDSW